MMLPSRLDCPLSLKTPNMGNTGIKALQAMEEAPPNRGDRCRRAVLANVQWGESAPPPGGVGIPCED